MKRTPGRIRRRLAAALQRDIPDIKGRPVTWLPERLHRREGRNTFGCDAYAWSGSPIAPDTGNSAGLYDSWYPMTECIQAPRLLLAGNEIEIS